MRVHFIIFIITEGFIAESSVRAATNSVANVNCEAIDLGTCSQVTSLASPEVPLAQCTENLTPVLKGSRLFL